MERVLSVELYNRDLNPPRRCLSLSFEISRFSTPGERYCDAMALDIVCVDTLAFANHLKPVTYESDAAH